jgi:hypothetical protein
MDEFCLLIGCTSCNIRVSGALVQQRMVRYCISDGPVLCGYTAIFLTWSPDYS